MQRDNDSISAVIMDVQTTSLVHDVHYLVSPSISIRMDMRLHSSYQDIGASRGIDDGIVTQHAPTSNRSVG
jgi:hypothetical protein